jgi:predicted nucleotidyltransferase
MTQPVSQDRSSLDELASRCSESWAHLAAARQGASQEKQRIADVLSQERLVPPDTSVIVFGSLARGEWTNGSDVDWTLLVDGPADQAHLEVVQQITRHLKRLGYKDPGRTAMFGGLAFSHDLVHRIGGDHDTNRNTTQRILLLLESETVGTGDLVRDRVIRQILRRYVEEDHEYRKPSDWTPQIPRFLLNDVVRYWRTMAVDSAAKRREREGEGWALRNFKLRMSRKLIFAAGLAACVSCKLRPSEPLRDGTSTSDEAFCAAMTDLLFGFVNRTPIEILAHTVLAFEAFEAGRRMYGAYDSFLGILRDAKKRRDLEALTVDEAFSDPLFQEAREIGAEFQVGLEKLFFETDPELTRTTQHYGVF